MSEEAIEFLKKLIRIRSINPPGNEGEVAQAIAELLVKHGLEAKCLELEEGRANLVGWLRGNSTSNRKRTLAVSGHMDVVPAGQIPWRHDPFSADEVDGKIYGRGTVDMKGGLAALVFAMLELKEEGAVLNGDVQLLATAGEEAGAVGSKRLYEAGYMDEVDALLVAEPTGGKIMVANKGVLWVEITTYGKTAHGSLPHAGINAIAHMSSILHALFHEFEMSYEPDPLLGGPTFSVDVIEGGVKTNVVPDRCRIEIDFRTVPSQKHEHILEELQRLIDGVRRSTPDLRAEMRVFNDLPSVRTDPEDPFVRIVQEAVQEVYGEERPLSGVTAYTDCSRLVPPGSKQQPFVIICGADTALAHQPDEYIEVETFLQSIQLYKTIMKKYLS
ncbi:MAG: M20 family metallopeptidase [Alicyclobacillus sp.]|nr:M20 family metallopeptidase [Alicyclobacillus sp.]